jgi:hypothetical protein
MDPANILVLVLCVGSVALLVWFEINSRRNEASKKQSSASAQSGLDSLQKKPQSKVESEMDKANTA